MLNQRWPLTTVKCFGVLGVYTVYPGRGHGLLARRWWWWWWSLSCFSCSLAPSALVWTDAYVLVRVI